MDENLKIVAEAFQAIAELESKFRDKYFELQKMPCVKGVSSKMRWWRCDQNHLGLVGLPRHIVDIYVEAEIMDGLLDICWNLDIYRDRDYIGCEGSIFTSFEAHSQYLLEVCRETDNLRQFLIDLKEIADEVLQFPVPDALLNREKVPLEVLRQEFNVGPYDER